MPRGIKANIDYASQIKSVDSKIEKHMSQIEELKAERATLVEKKKDHDMKQLYNYVASKGMDVTQAIEMLKTSEGTPIETELVSSCVETATPTYASV